MIGLVLGLITGIFFGEKVAWLHYVGSIFINLLLITVIPYISLSLITGIGGLSYDEVKKLALKGGKILFFLWAISLSVVVLIPLSFPDWTSASFFSSSLLEDSVSIDFIRLFVPSNPFHAYANAIVPAVVVFSILLGTSLIGLPQKKTLLDPLSVILQAMIKITSIVSKVSPLGVFALIASLAGTTEVDDLVRLQVYIVTNAALCLLLSLVVFPGFIAIVTPFRYKDIIKALHVPMITAFATGSSLVVIPILIEQCKSLITSSWLKATDKEDADLSLETLIPTFYPFPSPAAILSLSFILFSGWYVGTDIEFSQYPALLSTGLVSMFGGTLLTIPFLLNLMQLPSDLYEMFVSLDVINSRFGTLVSSMHYATIGLIGSMIMVGKVQVRWYQMLQGLLITLALVVPLLLGIRAAYSNFVVDPYTLDDVLQSFYFLEKTQSATVNEPIETAVRRLDEKPATLNEIGKRGELRVCFQNDEYPSSFYNTANPPVLVGFDIEMAHQLALRMELLLELIPASSEKNAANLLNRGLCDIYMRTIPVTWLRNKIFGMTKPIFTSSVGVIVRDHRRSEFTTWAQIRKKAKSLTIAVERTADSIENMQISGIPESSLYMLDAIEDQRAIFETKNKKIDAVLDLAEEGAAWTLLYPEYSLVVPKPVINIPVAYSVARSNDQLLAAVNTWIELQQAQGNVDKLYRHYLLGEASKTEKKPRWSIMKDVLEWGE